jgi:hypothetical protein
VTVALVLGALLAVAAVVLVARPFLRDPVPARDVLEEPSPLAQRQLELAEERDRALAALKELEFDHRTGKVSDEDYRELVGPLRRRAAEALRALEPRAVYGSAAMTISPEPSPTPPSPEPSPLPGPAPSPPPGPPTPVPEPGPVPSPTPGPPTPVPEPGPIGPAEI